VSTAPAWLADAILYQIYPQSFADSDGDGIGDLNGVTEHLDHLAWLGVDTVWLNPCFTSPFRDAGYDVADYYTVASRYGGNDDLAKLVDQARRRGIRVLLDLVAGHTSDRHPWFQASSTDPGDHRYIWADTDALPEGFVRSPGSRPGGYLPNFFDFQPALNFGYARPDPAEPWRQPVDAEGPRANRQALRDIMDHWLSLGVAGFRVDMAASLVKDDPTQAETATLWNEVRRWMDRRHPDAALLSEWGDPAVAVPAGFHADFFLQFGGPTDGLPWRSLLNNHHGTERESWSAGECYFDAGAKGTARTFVDAYTAARNAIGDGGLIALPTSNHDFARPVCGPRTAEQLPALFAFLLTWPTLPAIYYGDEIGMRYVSGLPDTEGSRLDTRYNRAGSRTPMQWDSTPNAGFSSAPANRLYLPVDADPHRPTVATQHGDPGSLLNTVRALIALRRNTPALHPDAGLEVLADAYPLVYLRGGDHLVVVNPGSGPAALTLPRHDTAELRLGTGVRIHRGEIRAEGHAWAVFRLPS
jgi:maltose alpha-D-glucosyltransferase/alpha-amylase